MYAIYGNICHQYTPNVSINLPLTWILWVWRLPMIFDPDTTEWLLDFFPQTIYGFTPDTPLLHDTPALVNRLLDGERFAGRAAGQPGVPWGMPPRNIGILWDYLVVNYPRIVVVG